jgi:thioredoxin-dependent peroxiredoxin
MRNRITTALLAVGVLGVAAPAQAQEESSLLAVGETAPEFTLPGATRYGLLQDQVSLSDYRGETVVLAFFFRARTRG